MQLFKVAPAIHYFDKVSGFIDEFSLGKGDILVTSERLYNQYIKPAGIDIPVIFQSDYGTGEPSDEMIDAMAADMKKYDYSRIIAFGGGTVMDISKILALKINDKVVKLFTGETAPEKTAELVLIPTTCGTGSEVTNIAIAELKSLNVKKGLAVDETYADHAVLIAEPLENLPDYVFSTSSIDALIHAAESFLSPRAAEYSEMYSLKAIEMIMNGYMTILDRGGNTQENRKDLLKDFCIAANYAGIANINAGCAAVHALSYSIGGAFHVPHGEANYQFFTEVFKMYMKKDPEGRIRKINSLFADILGCDESEVYCRLEEVLDRIISRKALREYGMTEDQIDSFTDSTFENQQRLLNNNYVPLSHDDVREIFRSLY